MTTRARHSPTIDLNLSAAAALFVVFVLFTAGVKAHMFGRVDTLVTSWLQASLPRAIGIPFSIFSLLGSGELLTLILVGLLAVRRGRQEVIILFYYGIVLAFELAGKELITHPGPPVFPHAGLHLTLPSSFLETASSYPSGHAARTAFVSAVFYGSLSRAANRSTGWKVAAICLLMFINGVMAVSRIYLGDHWTSDVIGGLLLGLSLGLFSTALARCNLR